MLSQGTLTAMHLLLWLLSANVLCMEIGNDSYYEVDVVMANDNASFTAATANEIMTESHSLHDDARKTTESDKVLDSGVVGTALDAEDAGVTVTATVATSFSSNDDAKAATEADKSHALSTVRTTSHVRERNVATAASTTHSIRSEEGRSTEAGTVRDSDTVSATLGARAHGPFTESQMTLSTDPSTDSIQSVSDQQGVEKDLVQDDLIQGEHLFLSSDDVTQCLNQSETLHLTSSSGLELVYTSSSNTSGIEVDMQECLVHVTFPEKSVVRVDILQHLIQASCNSFYISISDLVSESILEAGFYGCRDRAQGPIYSHSNQILVELQVNLQDFATFRINLTAVPESSRPELVLEYTSNFTGFVQTPDWGGHKGYPPHMDSIVRLDVPTGHVIMISFPHVDIMEDRLCRNDRVLLYEGGTSYRNIIRKICGEDSLDPLVPEVHDTTVMYVRFVSYRWSVSSGSGFRLLFSFHKRTSQPEKLPGDRWNCSVPEWPKFRQHFSCDLLAQCVNGEDEMHCSYTTHLCGRGRVTLGGRCYILIKPDKSVSWNDASLTCLRQGARLASLNSPEEWKSVGDTMFRIANFIRVYTGLKSSAPFLPPLYRNVYQWSDGTIAYYLKLAGKMQKPACGSFRWQWMDKDLVMFLEECDVKRPAKILCEVDTHPEEDVLSGVEIHPVENWDNDVSVVRCPGGHVTHEFLSCDLRSSCWAEGSGSSVTCSRSDMTSPPVMFECTNGIQSVPYTLVCDYRVDCSDESDESFCVYPPCTFNAPFQCGNGQCLPMDGECDGVARCVNGADEAQCVPFLFPADIDTPRPPRVVTFDGLGNYNIWPANNTMYPVTQNASNYCPDTHFQCHVIFYCLPVYVRCNGVHDCPGREDEAACDSYTCPGFYRCRGSKICLHPDNLCDGVFQCPQNDDELLCGFTCPRHCVCDGLSFSCRQVFPAADFPELRFLNMSRSDVSTLDIRDNAMLVGLILSECNLTDFNLPALPNLRSLDVRSNRLTHVSGQKLRGLPNLKRLILSQNPLLSPVFTELDLHVLFPALETLDMFMVDIPELNTTALSVFPGLRALNLSGSNIDQVQGMGFQNLTKLHTLDLRGCPMTVLQQGLFQGLTELREVYADNYKLCCPEMLGSLSSLLHCEAPSDEISSCEALLRSDVYRVFLSAFASLALVGNLGSFVYRVRRVSTGLGFDVFVTHLCVSDFLMGVYLAIIGVADRLYQGTYLWKDVAWKESAACKVAGFLSLLSSEVSAFIICLITLDRFLVLRFPFSRLHFRNRSAQVACAVAWAAGIVLAAIPLLPVTSHWRFYGQSGICLPLPVTRNYFPGHMYSFGVMIVVNFVLFVLIAVGQFFIYWSIRTNSMSAADTTRKSKDLTIARRLLTIVVTDFLCWFPIGLLGIMASNSIPVPGEVNVAMVIFILPLNSALNPFLYTLNVILERRRLAREARMKKIVESKIQSMTVSAVHQRSVPNSSSALEILKLWLKSGSLSKEQVSSLLSDL